MTASREVQDSSAWIEVFTGGGKADYFLALLADKSTLVVPAITICHGQASAGQVGYDGQ